MSDAARIGDDASVAERAGTPLHPPLVPSHDIAIGDQPRGRARDRRRVYRSARPRTAGIRAPVATAASTVSASSVRGTPVRVLHDEAAFAAQRPGATRRRPRRAPSRCRRQLAGCRPRGTASARESCRWLRCSSRTRRRGTAAEAGPLPQPVEHVERALLVDDLKRVRDSS